MSLHEAMLSNHRCRSNQLQKTRLVCFVFLTGLSLATHARIGDTKKVAESRYKSKPTIYIKNANGFETGSYNTGSFSICNYYLDGYCVRCTYTKLFIADTSQNILMDEMKEIVTAETKRGEWKPIKKPNDTGLLYFDPTYAKFQHSNGTIMTVNRRKTQVDFVTPLYNKQLEKVAYQKEKDRLKNLSKF